MRDFHLPGRSTAYAANGMCATSHPFAAQEAVNVLRAGGNAVDAATTAALMLGLLEPAMTGIGGDMFALVWKPGEDKPRGLNGSGRAPAALNAAMLREQGHNTIPLDSAHAVSVPGAIDAFDTLLRDHGTQGWDTVLAPSIRLAREGHPIAPKAAYDWAQEGVGKLSGAARQHFLLDDRAPKAGERFAYPAKAEALELIAKEGRAGFYEGPVAEDMLSSLNALGGVHTLDDFANTACTWVEPISGDYRGTTLWELPPNGQGATAILMAKILAGFDLGALDPFGAERAHLEAETARLAYHARNCLIADADTPGAAERLAHMLSDSTVDAMRRRIDPTRMRPDLLAEADKLHALGPNGAPHRDTIYITVVDGDRMMVSLIYSVFHAFGGGLASTKYGINFQNRGGGFSLVEGHPNELAGGKRPMHTIIPAMLSKGATPMATFGVMGGQYQSCGHARAISNLLDYGMDPQAVMDGARCFPQDRKLDIERGYSPEVIEQLHVMGHTINRDIGPIGGGQMIVLDHANNCLIGGSDPRKDGVALGW
jgi:gamma-glutamyltranspeptidase/glutathione hydrolase